MFLGDIAHERLRVLVVMHGQRRRVLAHAAVFVCSRAGASIVKQLANGFVGKDGGFVVPLFVGAEHTGRKFRGANAA